MERRWDERQRDEEYDELRDTKTERQRDIGNEKMRDKEFVR